MIEEKILLIFMLNFMRLNDKAIKITIIILVFLDLLALDDITTGNEPDLRGEYAVLVCSVLAFAIIYYKRKLWIIKR